MKVKLSSHHAPFSKGLTLHSLTTNIFSQGAWQGALHEVPTPTPSHQCLFHGGEMEKSLGKEFCCCRELPVHAPGSCAAITPWGSGTAALSRAERAKQSGTGSTLLLSVAPTPPPTITTSTSAPRHILQATDEKDAFTIRVPSKSLSCWLHAHFLLVGNLKTLHLC